MIYGPRHQYPPGSLLASQRDLQLALYGLWDAHPFSRFVEHAARRLARVV